MEFDDIKEIWDTQNKKTMYAINEEALLNHIASKKNKAIHITNISELLLILVNLGAGIIVLILSFTNDKANISLYVMATWMLISGVFTGIKRWKRLTYSTRYDQSVLSHLKHAISVATYQVGLSQLYRWNILPMAILSVSAMLESGKPIWISAPMIIFFLLTHWASRWEHGIYETRKQELENLERTLVNPDQGNRV